MSMLAFRGDPDWDGASASRTPARSTRTRLCAAAAIATLELRRTRRCRRAPTRRATSCARPLRGDEARRRPGTCYGEASIYHVSFEGKPGLAGRIGRAGSASITFCGARS
jgi:hypothetical protein